MAILVAGLVLFLGVHLVPAFPARREALLARWGRPRYRLAFSAVADLSLNSSWMPPWRRWPNRVMEALRCELRKAHLPG